MNSILLLGDMFILTHYSIHNLCINHVNQQKHHTNQISHEPNKQKKICLPNFVINKKTQQRERKKKFDCRPNQSESTESINRLSIHPSIHQPINQSILLLLLLLLDHVSLSNTLIYYYLFISHYFHFHIFH